MDILSFEYGSVYVKYYPFLIFYIALFFLRPSFLVLAYIVMSVFQATSFIEVNLGEKLVKVPHYHFIAFLLTGRLVIDIVFRRFRYEDIKELFSSRIVVVLSLFVLYVVVSSFVLPKIFAGVLVDYPHDGISRSFVPVQWSIINLGQAVYLFITFVVLLYGLLSMQKEKIAYKEVALRLFEYISFFVVIVSVVQLLLRADGIYIFTFLFDHHPYQYSAGNGLMRVNGTFHEPSFLVVLLAPFVMYSMLRFFGGHRLKYGLFIVATALAVFGAGSTTWITGIAPLMLMLVAYGIYKRSFRDTMNATLLLLVGYILYVLAVETLPKKDIDVWFVVLLVFLIISIVGIVVASYRYSINIERKNIVKTTITIGVISMVAVVFLVVNYVDMSMFDATNIQRHLNKISTSHVRIVSDLRSWDIFLETYGLGVGVGSHRNSSFLFYMLATTGFIGTFLFGYFLWLLFYKGIKIQKVCQDQPISLILTISLIYMVAIKSIAIPDLVFPTMWVFVLMSLLYSLDNKLNYRNEI
ncbi:MAG: hypothetical protein ACLFOC_07435 [Campylobacterales bacterium]